MLRFRSKYAFIISQNDRMATVRSSSCKHGLQSAGALRPTWQHRRRSSRDVNDTASLNQFNPRILKIIRETQD